MYIKPETPKLILAQHARTRSSSRRPHWPQFMKTWSICHVWTCLQTWVDFNCLDVRCILQSDLFYNIDFIFQAFSLVGCLKSWPLIGWLNVGEALQGNLNPNFPLTVPISPWPTKTSPHQPRRHHDQKVLCDRLTWSDILIFIRPAHKVQWGD